MSAVLGRITIYPIKSLDGVDVDSINALPNGALENDRRFALVDADGRIVNGKRTAAIHRIRAKFNLAQLTVRLNDTNEFSLLHEQRDIGRWLSTFLDIACGLVENVAGGFPDDTVSPGPTVISTATLAQVANWFPDLTLEQVRHRFRANLEMADTEPFWEDHLVGPTDAGVPFQIGDVNWLGVNPCQRCVVPTRDTQNGVATPGFQKAFALERERHLPAWAPRERFNHFYRLAVNTQLAPGQLSARLRLGQNVTLG